MAPDISEEGTEYLDKVSDQFNEVSGKGANPVPDFSFVADALEVTFTDETTDADGTIAARVWTFGDGDSATTEDPVHTYDEAGEYNVVLTVVDNTGNSESTNQTVEVEEGA